MDIEFLKCFKTEHLLTMPRAADSAAAVADATAAAVTMRGLGGRRSLTLYQWSVDDNPLKY